MEYFSHKLHYYYFVIRFVEWYLQIWKYRIEMKKKEMKNCFWTCTQFNFLHFIKITNYRFEIDVTINENHIFLDIDLTTVNKIIVKQYASSGLNFSSSSDQIFVDWTIVSRKSNYTIVDRIISWGCTPLVLFYPQIPLWNYAVIYVLFIYSTNSFDSSFLIF